MSRTFKPCMDILPPAQSAAREIFGPLFQPSESLKAMVYFEDGDLFTLTNDERKTLHAASSVRDLPAVPILSKQLVRNHAKTF